MSKVTEQNHSNLNYPRAVGFPTIFLYSKVKAVMHKRAKGWAWQKE